MVNNFNVKNDNYDEQKVNDDEVLNQLIDQKCAELVKKVEEVFGRFLKR